MKPKPIDVSLNELEAILAVMQEGSFRAAAAVLRISQPTVSARIQHVEDVLGVKLFHRTTRRVEATEYGKQLGIRAEHTITGLRALLQDFRREAQLNKGLVVIGATPAVAATALPRVLQEFTRRWPGIEMVLRDDFFGRSLERLKTGEVDFAITPFRYDNSKLNFESLYWEEIVLVVPNSNPISTQRVADFREIAKYPLLIMGPQSAMWKTVSDAFAANGQQFRPIFQTMHQLTLLSMVRAGWGVTFLPIQSLELLNMEGLSTVRAGSSGLFREVGITTTHTQTLQPAGKALIRLLRARLRQDSPNTMEIGSTI